MNTDQKILEKILRSDGRISYSKVKILSKTDLDYLYNRYSDSLSLEETLYRLKNNIETRPTCPICGKKLEFKYREFRTYCSPQCKSKDSKVTEKIQQTSLLKYGVKFPMQNKEVKEKWEQIFLQKYGVKSPLDSSIIREKIKSTDLQKYGVKYHISAPSIKNKSHATLFQKYGNSVLSHIPEIQCKKEQTVLSKYGVSNVFQSNAVKNILKAKQKETTAKIWESKKRNNTTNTSAIEKICFDILSSVFTVYKQYKSKEYPFYCDFYIPELQLFIELNYSWTHGDHPYMQKDADDIVKLNIWKEKNSKYYNNAINVWTYRDPLKIQTAINNNLNYLCIYRNFNIFQIIQVIDKNFSPNTINKQLIIGV